MSRTRSSHALAATVAVAGLVAAVALAACGGSANPTNPPTPTPVPTPTPAPTPTPDPNVPPAGSGCGKPYPPPISRFKVYIHFKERDYWYVDSTPLVGPNLQYCASVGYTDGRTICTIRMEGVEDRLACELWRTGNAKDTGQPGPTWTVTLKDGTTTYCTGPTGPCEHHPDGPFQVKAYKGGLYRACAANEACGDVDVDRGL
jgi:hypothetical protein